MINADRPVSDSTTGAFEHLDAAEEEVPRRSTFRLHGAQIGALARF